MEGRERECHYISIVCAVFFLVRVDGPEPIWNSVTALSLSLLIVVKCCPRQDIKLPALCSTTIEVALPAELAFP